MSSRHNFTHAELNQYFDRLSLPKSKRIFDVTKLADGNKLDFLQLLQKHQLAKVPWENLTQHYSWHRVVNVKPKHLFNKIVNSPGRGGYCMEVNFFFHHILLSLGYDVYLAGARIYRTPTKIFGGWTHIVNLVTVAGKKYMLDGGFGGNGPTSLVLVEHDVVAPQIAPAQMRVVHEAIPQFRDRSQKVWIYQFRINEEAEWEPCYCFTDIEFLVQDVESMNFAPMLNPQTFFTHKVVCCRFTTDREFDRGDQSPGSPDEEAMIGNIDGKLTMYHDTLKWRRRDEKVLDLHFKTEDERVSAFRKYFGIAIADEDHEAIVGAAGGLGEV